MKLGDVVKDTVSGFSGCLTEDNGAMVEITPYPDVSKPDQVPMWFPKSEVEVLYDGDNLKGL